MNTREQGITGVGAAIAYFTSKQYPISIPLGEVQRYDLVVDIGGKLNRVECKTATMKRGNGYEVVLKTCGGNQSCSTIKTFDASAVDYVFVMTGGGRKFFIPSSAIKAKHQINVGGKSYNEFEVK